MSIPEIARVLPGDMFPKSGSYTRALLKIKQNKEFLTCRAAKTAIIKHNWKNITALLVGMTIAGCFEGYCGHETRTAAVLGRREERGGSYSRCETSKTAASRTMKATSAMASCLVNASGHRRVRPWAPW